MFPALGRLLALAALALLSGPLPSPARAEPFATMDAAALAALGEAMGTRTRFEYAGVIYRTPEGYGYTRAQTSRMETGFELRVRAGVDYPEDAAIVAFYHTHPRSAGRRGDAHSPHDVDEARRTGKFSYLGEVRSGEVRRYDPSVRPSAPLGYERGSALGVLVEPQPGEVRIVQTP